MTADTSYPRFRLLSPALIAFVSSASLMVVELVVSRIIAPRVGVSLHTWTSVIGVALAGISLGAYIGGRLSDRRASTALLGALFTAASLSVLAIIWLNNDLHEAKLPFDAPLMVWVLLYVGGVFFVPAVFLGCITPVLVKVSLRDLRTTGATVGRIYAWSTVGSIVGTFATGFFLISWLGTKNTLLGVAILLILLGVVFWMRASRRKALKRTGISLALFALSLFGIYQTGFLQSECLVETNYYCINVHEEMMGGRNIRQLLLDRLVHSYSDVDDPTNLLYDYEKTYVGVLAPMMAERPDMDVFFIGGGGYTLPRYFEATLPESDLVVTEIDPGVTEAAYEWLGLERDTDMDIYHMDARRFMAWEAEPNSYDVIFGDAFNDYSVPFHLTTLEFAQLVARALRDDGVYLANIIDGGRHGHFMRAYVRTLQQVFEHVAVIPSIEEWRYSVRTTFVVVASHQPLDLSHLPQEYEPLDPGTLDAYLALEPPILLTDDYVPVDNLMAPVVEDSFYAFTLEPEMMALIVERVVAIGGVILVGIAALVAWVLYRRHKRRAN